MARYNCSFSIEKDNNIEKKFEVIETDSKNKDYLIKTIQKRYPSHNIIIKRISDSINGKPEIL